MLSCSSKPFLTFPNRLQHKNVTHHCDIVLVVVGLVGLPNLRNSEYRDVRETLQPSVAAIKIIILIEDHVHIRQDIVKKESKNVKSCFKIKIKIYAFFVI